MANNMWLIYFLFIYYNHFHPTDQSEFVWQKMYSIWFDIRFFGAQHRFNTIPPMSGLSVQLYISTSRTYVTTIEQRKNMKYQSLRLPRSCWRSGLGSPGRQSISPPTALMGSATGCQIVQLITNQKKTAITFKSLNPREKDKDGS